VKILFISARYAGGVGGQAAMLAAHLSKGGHDVTKMTIPHIPVSGVKNLSFALLSSIKSMASSERYDIAHAFNVPAGPAMKHANAKKKVMSVYGVYWEQISALHHSRLGQLSGMLAPRIMEWADVLTTDSRTTQDRYGELGFGFEYLPSAIDAGLFKDIPKVEKVRGQVAYVGRDSPEKGIDVLRSIERKIHGKVVYCTDMKWREAMKILRASEVVVLPSRIESLPTTIKEAFMLKVPVVATRVGGVPELVRHGETGFLVESEDGERMADSINGILDGSTDTGDIVESAHDWVLANMTWDVVLPRYLKMYENLLRDA
jgi:glycosyltransferase involved in cell wall biosynthesis